MAAILFSTPELWEFPIPLTVVMCVAAGIYLRGWFRLRSARVEVLSIWHAVSFLLGLASIWVAIGSPLAAFDEESLTVHMAQHLLLMTFAPPLIWLGAPVMPFLHGVPRSFVQRILAPVLRWQVAQAIGRAISRPVFCWLAATAALIGWHVPVAFTAALHSEGLHVCEHASFLAAGMLFWWPVVRPWPSGANATPAQWPILLYLFLATLPCDVLSGFLVFCDRVVYSAYLSAPGRLALSVLEDQERAGALMWTCVTVLYLVPAVIITARLLSPQNHLARAPMAEPFTEAEAVHTEPSEAEVA